MSTILFSKNSEIISEMDMDDPYAPDMVLTVDSGSIIRKITRLIPINRTESTHKYGIIPFRTGRFNKNKL